jgi:histidyl-tRNA synthetase
LEKLEGDAELNTIASAKAGLKDMRLLFEYLQVYDVLDKVSSCMRVAIRTDNFSSASTCPSLVV